MKLYDDYKDEFCTLEYDDVDNRFVLSYDGYCEDAYNLDGLRIMEE